MSEQVRRLKAFSDTPRYNIKAVMQQTQVNVSTLRAWEQRYGVPQPQRSEHGHRLYSQRDIELIKWLRRCTEDGVSIGQAVALLTDQVAEASVVDAVQQRPIASDEPLWATNREQLTTALLRLDARGAHLQVNQLLTLFPGATVVLRLFQPLLAELGERWSLSDQCVADERFVSNFVRQRLLAMINTHEPFTSGPRVICCCPPNEQHELGLLMFAVLLEARGWDVVYLGQDVALDRLDVFLRKVAPALVTVAVSMTENLVGVIEMSRVVEANAASGLAMGYCGRVFTAQPELRNLPGIYLGDNFETACERAQSIIDGLGGGQ